MLRQLLLFFLSLYGTDWVQTITHGLSATNITHFILGLAVMRLLFHLTFLSFSVSDSRFRGYSFFGVVVCLFILLITLFGPNNGLAVGIRGVFVIESLLAPFVLVLLSRRSDARPDAAKRELEKEPTQRPDPLKDRFLTNISHEFRTPLTLLLGPIEDLQQRFPTDATYSSMHRNAQRLHTLINQLLDLAKLDAGQLHPNRQLGNVAANIQEWTTAFETMAQNRGIELTLDQSDDAWQALYDADKVGKIATNLIANALKFTNRGGKVEIEVVYETAGLTLRINDTGVGIPPENLPTIFDRFYQADPPKKNNPVAAMYEGAGVGLALVRELIELLDGSIGVASLVGEGTTFTVWIPMEAQPTPTLKVAEQPNGFSKPFLF